eukprot:TRINITY_DN3744_c0_g1_i4.p1 TRINITY_DN3744_c0_g1~~TRINITY_DN3744_c0_g1_i4.p1  ORF type:complete len:148 (-),score=5.18 TRINITY_DN3744_c0_g1_i4:20-439(-)
MYFSSRVVFMCSACVPLWCVRILQVTLRQPDAVTALRRRRGVALREKSTRDVKLTLDPVALGLDVLHQVTVLLLLARVGAGDVDVCMCVVSVDLRCVPSTANNTWLHVTAEFTRYPSSIARKWGPDECCPQLTHTSVSC